MKAANKNVEKLPNGVNKGSKLTPVYIFHIVAISLLHCIPDDMLAHHTMEWYEALLRLPAVRGHLHF